MDAQTAIANAVTIIGGLGGIGVIFDQVLVTEATRDNIHKFLRRSNNSKTFSSAFFEYISLINESVFRRFFSASIFSLKYFLSCAVVSLISLTLIVLVQSYVYGTGWVTELTLSDFEIAIIAICIIGNLFIDWISIAQTQVFFAISQEQKSIGRALLLIVSDFILTINFFTFLYAAVVGTLILGFASENDQAKIQTTAFITNDEEPKNTQTRSPIDNAIFGQDKPIYSTTYFLNRITPDEEPKSLGWLVVKSDTHNYTFGDFLRITNSVFKNDVTSVSGYFVENNESKKTKIKYEIRGSDEWMKISKDAIEEVQEIDLRIPHSATRWSFELAYTAAYVRIDNLQDEFPASILMEPSFLPMPNLMAAYFSLLGARANGLIVGCRQQHDGKAQWVQGDQACDSHLYVSANNFFEFIGKIKASADDSAKIKFPLNSLFMTSLTMTALIYISALFLIASRLLTQRILLSIRRVETYFLKSPFAFVGLGLGAAIFIITSW